MRVHELKIGAPYLIDLLSGEKTFELRFDDRNFQKGDVLCFKSWNITFDSEIDDEFDFPEEVKFNVLSVFHGVPTMGLREGWVILSLRQQK